MQTAISTLLNYWEQPFPELRLATAQEYAKWQRPEEFKKAKNLRKKKPQNGLGAQEHF